jgi:preprotein translocase subunit SecE
MAVEGKGNVITAFLTNIISFFREMKAEFKRITWPSKENTKKSFTATLVFVFIWVIVVFLLDKAFLFLFDKIILK